MWDNIYESRGWLAKNQVDTLLRENSVNISNDRYNLCCLSAGYTSGAIAAMFYEQYVLTFVTIS